MLKDWVAEDLFLNILTIKPVSVVNRLLDYDSFSWILSAIDSFILLLLIANNISGEKIDGCARLWSPYCMAVSHSRNVIALLIADDYDFSGLDEMCRNYVSCSFAITGTREMFHLFLG